MQEDSKAGCPAEVPLHQHMQLGKQTRDRNHQWLLENHYVVAITETWWMIPMTEVWLLTATCCSGRTDREGREEAFPSTSRNKYCVKSCP